MKFRQIVGPADADAIFITVHNNEGSALARGIVVEMDVPADSGCVPGRSVEKGDSAAATLVAGVVQGQSLAGVADIPTGGTGFVQTYGYHSAVRTDDSVAAAGEVLVTDANGLADVGAEGTQTLGIFGVALAADSGSPATAPAFIRCM